MREFILFRNVEYPIIEIGDTLYVNRFGDLFKLTEYEDGKSYCEHCKFEDMPSSIFPCNMCTHTRLSEKYMLQCPVDSPFEPDCDDCDNDEINLHDACVGCPLYDQ